MWHPANSLNQLSLLSEYFEDCGTVKKSNQSHLLAGESTSELSGAEFYFFVLSTQSPHNYHTIPS